jgi:NAD(P)-dependent dehydrogenase (short-subunit alcohol dehydrogenase family)
MAPSQNLFDVKGKVVVITGGGGVLCSAMAKALAAQGAKVALLDLRPEAAQATADAINKTTPGAAIAVATNVLERKSLEAARDTVLKAFQRVDVLINGAGGNKKDATTSAELSFFDLPPEAIRWVFDLNIIGTVLPSQVFGRLLAEQGEGCIVNVSSMSAFRPLTRGIAYAAAKAGVSNFTEWLAVHMSQNYSKKIRVNAIAPGFLLTEQNRYLMTDEKTGELTPRGKTVLGHTPMDRFGEPEELVGAVIWLISPAATFVHGAVIPIDGGFNAFSGV